MTSNRQPPHRTPRSTRKSDHYPFKIGHINVKRLTSSYHFTLLEAHIISKHFEAFAITETFYQPTIQDSLVSLDDYNIFRNIFDFIELTLSIINPQPPKTITPWNLRNINITVLHDQLVTNLPLSVIQCNISPAIDDLEASLSSAIIS